MSDQPGYIERHDLSLPDEDSSPMGKIGWMEAMLDHALDNLDEPENDREAKALARIKYVRDHMAAAAREGRREARR